MRQCNSQVVRASEHNFVYIKCSINKMKIKFVNNNKLPQAMFLGKTVYYYNRLMVTHIGMKFTIYTHILRHPHDTQMVSMATTNNKQPQAVFFNITSSLLKLAYYDAHGDEYLCAYIFHCFHDNRQQKMPSGTFPYNYFFTSQTCKPCNAWK